MLEWLLVGTGVTGAFTLVWLWRETKRKLGLIPALHYHFSPKGGCTEAIVAELGHARRQILVQAYSFTCPSIADALIAAKKRGVDVVILLDRANEKETYSELKVLAEHGVVPLIDATHAIAHNKIMIIDKRTLITGSFNFTRQAEHENAENLLILKHHPELVSAYVQNFESHRSHCVAPGTAKPVAAHVGHEHRRAA